MSNSDLVYICKDCGAATLRIKSNDSYIHPCTYCSSKNIFQADITPKEYFSMKRKRTLEKYIISLIGDNSAQWQENINEAKVKNQIFRESVKPISNEHKLIPHCPTCDSTKVRHISATERGANAVVFGFLGNKRKKQFECLNCKYMW